MVTAVSRDDLPELARRFSVTHLLFPPPRTPAGLATAARVTAGGHLLGLDPRAGNQVWTVPHRAWASFPEEVVSAPNRDAAIAAVVELFRAGNAAAVVESDAPLPASTGRVLAVDRGTEAVRIVAEAASDATLVVNDAYARGWRAQIDGAEVRIEPADVVMRAVRFPAGRHVVVMRYAPPEVLLGAWVSLLGLSVVAVLLAVPRRFRARDVAPEPAPG
jgi:hypothetical protein